MLGYGDCCATCKHSEEHKSADYLVYCHLQKGNRFNIRICRDFEKLEVLKRFNEINMDI